MPESLSTETVVVEEPHCQTCHNQMWWRDCYNCDEDGFSDHDCGEDCCACLYPEPNVVCDICRGKAGWFQCSHCHPWDD